MLILASFISGSLVTGLVTFIAVYYTKKRNPLKTQRALVETAVLRDKVLELVSAESVDDSEKALMVCSVQELSIPSKQSFTKFMNKFDEFKKKAEEVRALFESYDNETYDSRCYVDSVDELLKWNENNILKNSKTVAGLEKLIVSENRFPEERLYELKQQFREHVKKVDMRKKKEKISEEINSIYAHLVKTYDPYYYMSATKLKSDFQESGEESDFNKFANECLRLSDLQKEIIELISETARKAEIEPGLNLLDVNLINTWLAEIGNKNYMSNKNPLSDFYADWQEFDSKRKELARKRGKAQIWTLAKLPQS